MTVTSYQNNYTAPAVCPKGDAPCGYLAEIDNLRDEVSRLTEQIRIDALTGLYNFRFFTEALAIEMERTRRSEQPMALVILDIDHFKTFNDCWGHDLGNKALGHVAQLINFAVRKLDMACRFGGEEFVIILPNTELRQAVQVAERLRATIASTAFAVPHHEPVTITVSLGVDIFRGQNGDTADCLLQRADALLYQAKRDGRNRLAHPHIEILSDRGAVTPEEKDALVETHQIRP